MRTYSFIFMGFCLLHPAADLAAGERITLMATSKSSGFSDSAQSVTLGAGDSVSVLFAGPVSSGFYFIVTIDGKELAFTSRVTVNGESQTNPVIIAGPAVVKARIGPSTPSLTGLMTLEVTRAGAAATSAALPISAGSTWQVILEGSSDLITWSSITPGDYPGDGPQKYFRTRLVRRDP